MLRKPKNCDARLKAAAERLLEITKREKVATCFPNGVSVAAQSPYQVQLHEISQRSLATAIEILDRKGTRKLMEETFQLTHCEENVQPIHESDEVSDFDFIRVVVFAYNYDDGEEVELGLYRIYVKPLLY